MQQVETEFLETKEQKPLRCFVTLMLSSIFELIEKAQFIFGEIEKVPP